MRHAPSCKTIIHKNGDVTAWDPFAKIMQRLPTIELMRSRCWAGLSTIDQARIEAAAKGRTLAQSLRIARAIIARANKAGLIPPGYIAKYSDDPRARGVTDTHEAIIMAGVLWAAQHVYYWEHIAD